MPRQLSNLYSKSYFYDACVDKMPSPTESKQLQQLCPLRHWNAGVRRLTFKCVGKDLSQCYKTLVSLADKAEFEDKLSEDPSLFL